MTFILKHAPVPQQEHEGIMQGGGHYISTYIPGLPRPSTHTDQETHALRRDSQNSLYTNEAFDWLQIGCDNSDHRPKTHGERKGIWCSKTWRFFVGVILTVSAAVVRHCVEINPSLLYDCKLFTLHRLLFQWLRIVQDCSSSSALAMEWLQSCIEPSIS